MQRLNAEHLAERGPDLALEARIRAMETAFRMQTTASDAFDVRREPDRVRERLWQGSLRRCLLAVAPAGGARRPLRADLLRRRPALGHAPQSQRNARASCAGTSISRSPPCWTDLKTRGLLDDTLVVWGGEFGRTPTSESGDGRDHNHWGFTMWLAGGGVKGGMAYGANRRVRLPRRRRQGPRPRPARHHPAPARHRPREADLPLRRPRFPPDRRARQRREEHPQRIIAARRRGCLFGNRFTEQRRPASPPLCWGE